MHSLKQFLFTLITERQRYEDKYFTFTIFISILSIVNQHTSHTSISIFIRNVVVSSYTHKNVGISLWKCQKLMKKNLKCHFPQITKDFKKKKKKRQNWPADCTINGIRHGNMVAVFGHFWSLGHFGEYFF